MCLQKFHEVCELIIPTKPSHTSAWWQHEMESYPHYWPFVGRTTSHTGGFPNKWPVMWWPDFLRVFTFKSRRVSISCTDNILNFDERQTSLVAHSVRLQRDGFPVWERDTAFEHFGAWHGIFQKRYFNTLLQHDCWCPGSLCHRASTNMLLTAGASFTNRY